MDEKRLLTREDADRIIREALAKARSNRKNNPEKMKCTHPKNYWNDCNGDTCPTGDFEIMIALAEGTCDWGKWEKEKEKK